MLAILDPDEAPIRKEMMSDRRIDITGLQVLAGLLATVTGTVAASYFGVAGTIIGAAVMSVANTAGSAVYRHYLGRTAGRLKELKEAAPMVAHKAAERMTGAGTRTSPQRPHHSQAGEDELSAVVPPVRQLPASGREPGRGTASNPGERPSHETAATSAGAGDHAGGGHRHVAGLGGESGWEAAARSAGAGDHAGGGHRRVAGLGGESGWEAAATSAGADDHTVGGYRGADGTPRRPWRWSLLLPGWLRGRPRWLLGGAATIGLFVGVVGGITLFELAAGKPLNAVVWHRSGSGTTVGGIVGSQPSHSTARTAKPSGKASSPAPSGSPVNSPSPSPTPSSGSPSPTPSGSPSPAPGSSSSSATPAASLPSARPQSQSS